MGTSNLKEKKQVLKKWDCNSPYNWQSNLDITSYWEKYYHGWTSVHGFMAKEKAEESNTEVTKQNTNY